MNNYEKNTYVKEQITLTLLDMMQETPIDSISIKELCDKAGVGRASFYRNYNTKEDVIKEHAATLLKSWGSEFEANPNSSINNVFGSLFEHYRANKDIYILIHNAGLSEIILDTIIAKVELEPSLPNPIAYHKAFFAYGLYGWICEWISRGMPESADEINQMLNNLHT